eukprot:4112408-Prymnesium_polylepis.2
MENTGHERPSHTTRTHTDRDMSEPSAGTIGHDRGEACGEPAVCTSPFAMGGAADTAPIWA